jgi:hypothetical protein
VRTLLALIAVSAAVVIPTASATTQKVVVTLNPSTVKVLYGHHVTLSGRVYGKAPGAAVTLLAWHHNASAPVKVAVVHTDRKGRYSFKVLPARQTQYKVRDAATLSRAITVGVEPSLALKEMGDGRIAAHVAPARAMAGKFVELELLHGGVWSVIHKSKLSHAGATTFGPLPASRSGSVRLALSVNEAGAGYLGALSHALAYHVLELTLEPAAFKVLYGHSTMLHGRLWNGQAGQTVRIKAWVLGHSAPITLADVRTGANGVWSLRVAPRVQTSYQAQWTSLHVSARERVGVAPAISISRLTGDRIATHVSAGRSFAGRSVIVQRQVAPGIWVKVARATLNRNSSAVIPLTVPSSTLRVAMSINEAGVGYLAGVSRTLVYKP